MSSVLREKLSKPPATGPQHWSLGRQNSKTDKGPILTLLSTGGDLGKSCRLPEPQHLHLQDGYDDACPTEGTRDTVYEAIGIEQEPIRAT